MKRERVSGARVRGRGRRDALRGRASAVAGASRHLAAVARDVASRRIGRAEWEHVPEGFAAAEADPAIKGWNVDSVLEANRASWERVRAWLEDARPFAVDPRSGRPDLALHNTLMTYAYCLALAARGRERLSMLDWGGGFGQYLAVSRALVPGLEIEYHCKDVPVLAGYGRELFPEATFHVDHSCLERSYDFVLASASLHYSEEWRATLAGLAGATAGHLLVTRLFVLESAESYVFVQRPYSAGYGTEYLGWALNRRDFLDAAERGGMRLVREFAIAGAPYIRHAPQQSLHRGYLFTPG